MTKATTISKELLNLHHCLEDADRVPGDPKMTKYKRMTRLYQALWRERNGHQIGTQPHRIEMGKKYRLLGNCMNLDYSKETGANFLSDKIIAAVNNRLSFKEPHQMIDEDRLWCNLLSSMPLCFNLFGYFRENLEAATSAVKNWWPNTPGGVSEIRFEWSPGRMNSEYLNNKSAFDAAFILHLDNSSRGIIGVETKYHEHCKKEDKPEKGKQERYEQAMRDSRIFKDEAFELVFGSELQQILQDHLLALSMIQNTTDNWEWGKFVLVYPEKNSSYADATSRYSDLLKDAATFEGMTIESLLNDSVFSDEQIVAFRDRYIWE